jgi:hypothetical protein
VPPTHRGTPSRYEIIIVLTLMTSANKIFFEELTSVDIHRISDGVFSCRNPRLLERCG